ncbi:hypothetical protein BM613_11470 [Sulfoacidibacillus thermotolerans]|uniref:Uncharacterized protein n=1 Tax=Sulfoacidibacillus thermotolerans TaxID=1765684 RepID=A0A2U3D6E1_SULT2|nr:hypothetical protein BM613_11470 [Sulfoacidibacillus thermotolerans]
MHILVKILARLVLIIICGFVSARFFSYEKGTPFGFNRKTMKSRYFWMGAVTGIIFVFSDYRFAHFFSLPQ